MADMDGIAARWALRGSGSAKGGGEGERRQDRKQYLPPDHRALLSVVVAFFCWSMKSLASKKRGSQPKKITD